MIVITILMLCTALVIALFIIAASRKSKKKALLNFTLLSSYNRLIFIHRLVPDYCERIGNRMIAIDSTRNALIFVAHHTHSEETCIKLKDVGAARILMDEHDNGSISCVFLELENKRTKRLHMLNFYHESFDDAAELQQLMRKAVRWKHRIHRRISSEWTEANKLKPD